MQNKKTPSNATQTTGAENDNPVPRRPRETGKKETPNSPSTSPTNCLLKVRTTQTNTYTLRIVGSPPSMLRLETPLHACVPHAWIGSPGEVLMVGKLHNPGHSLATISVFIAPDSDQWQICCRALDLRQIYSQNSEMVAPWDR